MHPLIRLIAAGTALVLVAASCGGGTGEAPPAASPEPTVAPATQAVATAPPAPKVLTLVVDTVRGTLGVTDEEKKADNPASLVCVVMSKFPQGSRIVWRAVVTDPFTNKALDDKALESVTLTLADGKTVPLKYGPHGGTKENPAQFFWVVGWTVPTDYPTGGFTYKIDAKSLEGATGSYGFDTFKVPAAQLQIIPAGGTRRL